MDRETLLRRVLMLDAAICVGFGILCLALYGWLTGALALPGPLVTWAAAVVFAAAALMLFAALRHPLSPGLVWLVIAGNAGWVAASVALAFAGVSGTGLGTALMLVQALGVTGLTALEWAGLRGVVARVA